MTDVERFFRRLVGNLAATDPVRLHRPFPLEDIYRDIVPYRANRRALQLDTSEDYELVLLRLCAGEGGLVRTEPEEARARFVQETRSPNPDLDVLRSFENVVVTLRSEPLARALGPMPEPETALAERNVSQPVESEPAEPEPAEQELFETELLDAELPAEEPQSASRPRAEEHRPMCLYCGGALPADRPVNFCPHCGQNQTLHVCPECRSEVEPGWRHCVNCGTAIGEGRIR